MQAVILAAGKGTRTYPLTLTRPKPLLKAANKTLLEHSLEQLTGLVDEVIIIVHYRKEMIEEHIGTSYNGLAIRYISQKEARGTGHALQQAAGILKRRFLVLNGDDLYSRSDLERCIRHRFAVMIKNTTTPERFGVVVAKNNAVQRIEEKPKKPVSHLANVGVYVFSKEIFSIPLKKSSRGELEIVDYITALLRKGNRVEAVRAHEYWCPVSYPWDLLDANALLLQTIKKDIKGTIEPRATIKGKVIVGKGTAIKNGAYIEGPVKIGKNCLIGPNCYIRAWTSIGDGCKVGNGVEIKNSILFDGAAAGHLSYVGDSVLGMDVNLGAGTIAANLRHDGAQVKSMVQGELRDSNRRKLGAIIGDGVHTGIHTSIYPGRKIWPRKTTLPDEVVKKDIV